MAKLIAFFLCVDIALSIAIPEHDSIRFVGKYLLFALAIAISFKHASRPERISSLKWRAVLASFCFWMLGFSSNYLSECLYGEIKPSYEYFHNATYLIKMLLLLWAVLIPEGEFESKLDRYCRWSSMLLLASVYMYGLGISLNFEINGGHPGIDIFDLTDKYSAVVLLVIILAVKLLTTHNHSVRVLYSGLLVCIAALGFVESKRFMGMFLGGHHLLVLWDMCVADLPILLFLIVVHCDLDITRFLGLPGENLVMETIPSSLPLMIPMMTGFMALLLWKSHPYLIAASSVVIVCIFVYAVQSFIRQIYSQKELREVVNERTLLVNTLQQDPVTGIYSRRWFDETISLGCQDAKEGKPSITIFMIDVDNFKGYNDTLGHKAGDYCLRAVAVALRSGLGREKDAVARYGGDEMAAVLFQANAEGALAVAERMRLAVWDLNIIHPKNPHKRVTVSIGVGFAGNSSGLIMPTDLVLAADAALYESKASGKNTVTLKATTPVSDDTITALVMDREPLKTSNVIASLRGGGLSSSK